MYILSIIKTIRDYIWSAPLIIFILFTGLYLTIKLKGLQITKLKEAFFILFRRNKLKTNEVSTFQAICISLGATLGAGNIIGVGVAITMGGPGALVWMIVTIIITMPIKYMETYLASKYKRKQALYNESGPYIYIEDGMNKKYVFLAKLYAIFCMLASILGFGTFIQINGVTDAFKNIFNTDIYINNIYGNKISIISLLIGLMFSGISYFVIIGGIKKIGKVSEYLIPAVLIIYLSLCVILLTINYRLIPKVFKKIISNTFTKKAFSAGIIGIAIKEGVNKGIFASEAGIGSGAIAISESDEEPHKLGLATIGSTIFGTLFICILTGFVIIITNAYKQNLSGINIANYAFTNGIKINNTIISILLFICITIFAFTTIIGWNLYGVKCLSYLTKSKKIKNIYQWIYIMMIFVGAFLNSKNIWNLAETFNGLMIIPNLIAILYLTKKMYKE